MSRSASDATHRAVASEYIEVVSRLSCGTTHQNDGCVEGLIAACRERYGELYATFLLLSPSSMSEMILADGPRQKKSPWARTGALVHARTSRRGACRWSSAVTNEKAPAP